MASGSFINLELDAKIKSVCVADSNILVVEVDQRTFVPALFLEIQLYGRPMKVELENIEDGKTRIRTI